jgi:ABC-2 type transport system permease protein
VNASEAIQGFASPAVVTIIAMYVRSAALEGAGVVLLLFVGASVVSPTAVDWLAYASPTTYYDPTAILVRGEYDLVGAVVPVGFALGLLVLARTLFVRRDV